MKILFISIIVIIVFLEATNTRINLEKMSIESNLALNSNYSNKNIAKAE